MFRLNQTADFINGIVNIIKPFEMGQKRLVSVRADQLAAARVDLSLFAASGAPLFLTRFMTR